MLLKEYQDYVKLDDKLNDEHNQKMIDIDISFKEYLSYEPIFGDPNHINHGYNVMFCARSIAIAMLIVYLWIVV